MSQLLKSEIPVLISFENKMLTTGKKSTKKILTNCMTIKNDLSFY